MPRQQLQTLTEPMYYVLLSLIEENHGYGIMQQVQALTGGRVKLGAGTLYTLLSRFEKEKLIEYLREEDRKKIYRLTRKGYDTLHTEYARLCQMVAEGAPFFPGEAPAFGKEETR